MAFTYSPKFEAWWKGYPRKTGKEAAYRKWVELAGDQLLPLFQQCLICQIIDWKAEQRPPNMLPQAKTWLNSGAWKDYVKEDGTPDVSANSEREKDGYFFGGEWRPGGDSEHEPEQS